MDRYVRMMPRLCARPACSAPATATFTFDGLRRIVWLAPLADAAAYSAGDLCRRHADRLRAPQHWELRDLRPGPTVVAPAGTPAPSRHSPPPPAPTGPAPVLPFEGTPANAPAARRVGHPLLAPADPEAEPSPPPASSPLLARAFRNAG